MFLYLHETTLLAGYQVKNKTRKFDWEGKTKKKNYKQLISCANLHQLNQH